MTRGGDEPAVAGARATAHLVRTDGTVRVVGAGHGDQPEVRRAEPVLEEEGAARGRCGHPR